MFAYYMRTVHHPLYRLTLNQQNERINRYVLYQLNKYVAIGMMMHASCMRHSSTINERSDHFSLISVFVRFIHANEWDSCVFFGRQLGGIWFNAVTIVLGLCANELNGLCMETSSLHSCVNAQNVHELKKKTSNTTQTGKHKIEIHMTGPLV